MAGLDSTIPDYGAESFQQKTSKFFYNIWPNVYRVINGTFYFLIDFIKKFSAMAYRMIFNK